MNDNNIEDSTNAGIDSFAVVTVIIVTVVTVAFWLLGR